MLGVVVLALPLKCRLSPKKADTLQRLPEEARPLCCTWKWD